MEPAVTVEDLERVARERLPRDVYDFVAGGAGDERTLDDNVRAFDRWIVRPRVLRGVTEPDTATEILGIPVSLPVLIAPWAYQRMVHPEGERATARGAAAAWTLMVVPSPAARDLEAIAAASDAPKWWQLYVFRDRAFSEDVLHRAVAAGYAAIVFTVDLPVGGLRHRDARNRFEIPPELGPSIADYDPAIDWDDLAWIREHAPLPILVKGILTAEDARLAVEAGADGVVVSNHGGRQLDGVLASIDALPEVVAAVEGRIPVVLDGGVRRGIDVFRALALGADAVMIGRPIAFGLAAGGDEGVSWVLEMFRRELTNVMTLSGCRSIADVAPEMVTPRPAGSWSGGTRN